MLGTGDSTPSIGKTGNRKIMKIRLLSNQNVIIPTHRKNAAGFVICLLVISSLIALLAIPLLPSRAASPSAAMVEGINLLARPPILPADGGVYSSLVLQLVNTSSSVPIIPDANITVQLTSSNPQTGTVPSSVLFPAGQAYVVVPFQTTTSPGNTTVSAFASGYEPANLRLATQELGGIPIALNVTVSPDQIPPEQGLNVDVVVQAIDSFGNPVKLASNLVVTLSSSNSQIGSVPSTMVIPAGQSFALATFSPQLRRRQVSSDRLCFWLSVRLRDRIDCRPGPSPAGGLDRTSFAFGYSWSECHDVYTIAG